MGFDISESEYKVLIHHRVSTTMMNVATGDRETSGKQYKSIMSRIYDGWKRSSVLDMSKNEYFGFHRNVLFPSFILSAVRFIRSIRLLLQLLSLTICSQVIQWRGGHRRRCRHWAPSTGSSVR